jgi:hypothetical protein
VIPVGDPGGLPLVLRGLPPVDEVIVVDSGPAADTAAAVRAARPDALVIRPGRAGAGNALASGVAASSGEVVVTLAADGSTDPAEIPRYVAALTGGADVALGTRYRDGGRDLAGGRLRRLADLMLIWMVNVLFGTHRTDPGFGYAAFWRDALDCLDLPDPSGRHARAWGDGPEIGPLLAVRPEVRGLRVTEVGSTAYPRSRRPRRAERPGLRHWLRVLIEEYVHSEGRHTPTHATTPPPAPDTLGYPARPGPAVATRFVPRGPDSATGARSDHHLGAGSVSRLTPRSGAGSGGRSGSGKRSFGERAGTGSSGWSGADPGYRLGTAGRSVADPRFGSGRAGTGPAPGSHGPSWAESDRQPIWGPSAPGPTPVYDLWQRGENPVPHISMRPPALAKSQSWTGNPARPGLRDVKPRSAEDNRPDPAAARVVPPQPPREVGGRRRHLEDYRQRPDLRVINGEGTDNGRTRSGRLRPVPRENLGG